MSIESPKCYWREYQGKRILNWANGSREVVGHLGFMEILQVLVAEAWRKRRYEAAFIAKLNDCEAEAAETQTWIDFAVECGYIDSSTGQELYARYNQVLSGLVSMINNPSPWLLNR